MLDAVTRAIRKPRHVLGYLPELEAARILSPNVRLRREPDGPVTTRLDLDTNFYIPSPFRIGYKTDCRFRNLFVVRFLF